MSEAKRRASECEWRAFRREVHDEFGSVLATVESSDGARRIAACLNACRGMATKELEDGLVGDLLRFCNDAFAGSEKGKTLLRRLHGE